MASRSKRPRYSFDICFVNDDEKASFRKRLEGIRQRLTPANCPSIDNHTLMCAMMDALEEAHQSDSNNGGETVTEPSTTSFLRNSGMLFTINK